MDTNIRCTLTDAYGKHTKSPQTDARLKLDEFIHDFPSEESYLYIPHKQVRFVHWSLGDKVVLSFECFQFEFNHCSSRNLMEASNTPSITPSYSYETNRPNYMRICSTATVAQAQSFDITTAAKVMHRALLRCTLIGPFRRIPKAVHSPDRRCMKHPRLNFQLAHKVQDRRRVCNGKEM